MSNVSLTSQIKAIEFAIERVDRTVGHSGKAELHRQHLVGVLKTLRFVEKNEAAIRDVVARKGVGGAVS